MKFNTLFTLVFCILASAKASEPATARDKLYIQSQQIFIKDEGIFVDLFKNFYSVKGLFRDAQGLHVLAREIFEQHTFSNHCPLGHFSPDGSGMCNYQGCPFEKKK